MKPHPSMYEMIGKFLKEKESRLDEEHYVYAILKDSSGHLRPHVIDAHEAIENPPKYITLAASAKLDDFEELEPTIERCKNVIINIFNISMSSWSLYSKLK